MKIVITELQLKSIIKKSVTEAKKKPWYQSGKDWEWSPEDDEAVRKMAQDARDSQKAKRKKEHDEFIRLIKLGEKPKENTDDLNERKEIKKNKWTPLSKNEVDDFKNEIFKLINTAYSPIGGHANIKSPDDVPNEGDEFNIIDLDDDPDVDAVVMAKDKPAGKKFVALGHDNTPVSKSSAINRQVTLLKKPAYYVEASGKVAQILMAKGLEPITDPEIIEKALAGKEIEYIGNGFYNRVIAGEPIRKLLFGRPKVKK